MEDQNTEESTSRKVKPLTESAIRVKQEDESSTQEQSANPTHQPHNPDSIVAQASTSQEEDVIMPDFVDGAEVIPSSSNWIDPTEIESLIHVQQSQEQVKFIWTGSILCTWAESS